MMDFLTSVTIAGNELWRLLLFFIVILSSLIVGRVARFFLERSSNRTIEANRDLTAVTLKALARSVVLVSAVAGLWLGMGFLSVTGNLASMVDTAMRVIGAAAIGYVVYSLVDVVDYSLNRIVIRTNSKVDDMMVPLVGKSVRITICVLVILQIVEALSDKPVSSIIAGLGVGGLAIALAGQDTIKNFFGSLVIIADKPFEIGDRIVVDGHDGPVESVGFRSTKIRTLEGHLVTVANSELVTKSIRNVGKRPYIRRLANITITYDTPPEKVERALQILKGILRNHEGMHPDFPPRVFFNEFNDCSLNLIMIYWYHPPDYWQYLAFTENVNREILTQFNAEGIDFAFPTQTVYLANDEKRQLALRMLDKQG